MNSRFTPGTAAHAARRFAPLPLALFGLCVGAVVANTVLVITTADVREGMVDQVPASPWTPIGLLMWAVVGLLVASRHPSNPLGWLFLGIGALFTVGPLLDAYAMATTTDGAALAGREYAGWGSHTLLQNPAVFGLFATILLLFPTGSAAGPRWRRAAQVLSAGVIGYTVFVATRPGDLSEVLPLTPNPFGVAALEPIWPVVDMTLAILFLGGCIAGIISVVLRFRRATGVERQQLKWLLAGAAGLVTVVLSGPIVFWGNENLPAAAWMVTFVGGLTLLPLTAGFAILRYRLFEIDRIVSRTVSYGLVVVLLAGVYVGTTLLMSTVLRPVTGDGDLPIAAATLVAAAAFRPLHVRVRGAVERRFNRRRYDAARAVEGFGQSLRDQLDGTDVTRAMTALVRATFEPAHVGVWLARS